MGVALLGAPAAAFVLSPAARAFAEGRTRSVAPSADTRYSIADQAERFANAKATGDTRHLDIATVYDPSALKGKRVLITGGNQGLGLELTKELVVQGASVVVVGRRSSEALDALPNVQVITGVDVTDEETLQKTMVPAIKEPLDIV